MLGGIGERKAQLGSERVDSAFALREQLEYLKPVGVRDGFADSRQLPVEAVLELARVFRHDKVVNRLLE
jgi:hypothetical protein